MIKVFERQISCKKQNLALLYTLLSAEADRARSHQAYKTAVFATMSGEDAMHTG